MVEPSLVVPLVNRKLVHADAGAVATVASNKVIK